MISDNLTRVATYSANYNDKPVQLIVAPVAFLHIYVNVTLQYKLIFHFNEKNSKR